MAFDKKKHPYGPGSHAPLEDAKEMPGCYPIKGNEDSMLYHRPDSQSYKVTKPEVWFDSPSAAEEAGFTLAPRHKKDSVGSDYEPGGAEHPCSEADVKANRAAVGGASATSGSGSKKVSGKAADAKSEVKADAVDSDMSISADADDAKIGGKAAAAGAAGIAGAAGLAASKGGDAKDSITETTKASKKDIDLDSAKKDVKASKKDIDLDSAKKDVKASKKDIDLDSCLLYTSPSPRDRG